MLNADVDALPSDAPTDLLVHLDTHSTRSHVPDDARATLVRKVGHALLLRRVHLDVDVVPNLYSNEEMSRREGGVEERRV